jgi:hypothetical protein
MTFQESIDGTNFYNKLNADGSEYTMTPAVSGALELPMDDFKSAKYLRLRSGTAATPVNQTSARTLVVVFVALTANWPV